MKTLHPIPTANMQWEQTGLTWQTWALNMTWHAPKTVCFEAGMQTSAGCAFMPKTCFHVKTFPRFVTVMLDLLTFADFVLLQHFPKHWLEFPKCLNSRKHLSSFFIWTVFTPLQDVFAHGWRDVSSDSLRHSQMSEHFLLSTYIFIWCLLIS